MPKYIMALDQGTTSSRTVIFDEKSGVAVVCREESRLVYPKNGWVEQDAEELLDAQIRTAKAAMAKTGAASADIAAIGIANQRETVVVWDRHSGKPVYNAIVWQCRRTADFCADLSAEGFDDVVRKKCGLVMDAYFSASKIRWILDNVPGAKDKAERGDLLFGNVNTWLLWNLTGGLHVTDPSNASRTMLYNIHSMVWDRELLELFGVPSSMLPEVRPSSEVYGMSLPELFGGPIKISGMAGDQQAALFGQACFEPGTVKNTYGTGCFLLMNTGCVPVKSENGLLTTVAWQLGGRTEYALEGSVFTAGAAMQWLRDELGLIDDTADSSEMAASLDGKSDLNLGLYFVPAFTGLGAPYWDPYARGLIIGLTRDTSKAAIVRAALESIAFQTHDVLMAMRADSGHEIQTLRADGGASANDFLMGFQAGIIGAEVLRPACVETTALGAAYLAGLAVGFWRDKQEIVASRPAPTVFIPKLSQSARDAHILGWNKAVARAVGWY